MKRWFCILAMLPLVPVLNGCGLFRPGGTKVTNPGEGPGTEYPCGYHGDVCLDARTPDEKCCTVGKCANDGEPYCDNRPPSDPSDPIFFSAKYRLPRSAAQ